MARNRPFKNRLILWIAKLFSFRSNVSTLPQRILIVSTTGLGDALWATPVIESIRKKFPSAYFAALTSSIAKEVFAHNPFLNQIHSLKKSLFLNLTTLIWTLRKEKFDTVLLLHASQRLTPLICFLTGACRIIGTQGLNKGLDDLFTHRLPFSFEHEIERRLRFGAAIGALPTTRTLSYFPQPPEILEAKTWILEKASRPIWIGIHPGAQDSFRRWPISCFAKLGHLLQQCFRCEIFITGTLKELETLSSFKKSLPSAHLCDPTQSLRFLGGLFSHLHLLISNDTGPFHLGCALNVSTVGLYAATDPLIGGPHRAPKAIAIARPPTCFPCLKRKCRESFCMLQISPRQVLKSCIDILAKQGIESQREVDS